MFFHSSVINYSSWIINHRTWKLHNFKVLFHKFKLLQIIHGYIYIFWKVRYKSTLKWKKKNNNAFLPDILYGFQSLLWSKSMRNAHTLSEIDMQRPEPECACRQAKTVDKNKQVKYMLTLTIPKWSEPVHLAKIMEHYYHSVLAQWKNLFSKIRHHSRGEKKVDSRIW